MLIKIIEENSEQKCIDALEEIHNSSTNRNLLQCRFSSIGLKLAPDDILPLVKDILTDKDAYLFFCEDGDIFMQWGGYPKATLNEVINRVRSKYSKDDQHYLSEAFFKYYDFHVHGEDIRIECRNKLKKIQEKNQISKEKTNIEIAKIKDFDNQMLKTLNANLINKDSRKIIEILIVEDQVFSQKLLIATLSRKYKCHVAKNASEALVLYAMHAPDIVFLDIDLPDMNGHMLANLFGKVDKDAYIVMVTGNHYAADIEKAKKNKVKGFIVKPYNKQKILDAINKFCRVKKKGL